MDYEAFRLVLVDGVVREPRARGLWEHERQRQRRPGRQPAWAAAGMGGSPAATVSIGGIAWGFTLPGQGGYDRIVGASVSILEMPELTTTTDDQGEFTIDGVPVGSQATFVMEHEGYPLAYTGRRTACPRPMSTISPFKFRTTSSTRRSSSCWASRRIRTSARWSARSPDTAERSATPGIMDRPEPS